MGSGLALESLRSALASAAVPRITQRSPAPDSNSWAFWQHAATSDVDIVLRVAGESSASATYPGHSPVLEAASPAWKVRKHPTLNSYPNLKLAKQHLLSAIAAITTRVAQARNMPLLQPRETEDDAPS
jgi:hypothetical protein